LQRRRHVVDVFEKDGSAVGDFEQPAFLNIGAGERPACSTEQLALEQQLRQLPTVDVHEGLGCAVAVVMDDPRNEILARSTFTIQQNGGRVVCGGARHVAPQGIGRSGVSDNPLQAV
jgi:hypothetical protein